MDYENYRELYEAIYFFNRITQGKVGKLPKQFVKEEVKSLGLDESIDRAMMRILLVNDWIEEEGSDWILTDENKAKHQYVLEQIIDKNPNNSSIELFNKAIKAEQFFFNSISEAEYEIYSRYNFQVTFQIGKEVAKHLHLADTRVLELGGNSGGLASALLTTYKDCRYTIVDRPIPCRVGNELKDLNQLDITFLEGDVFELDLEDECYDYIIIMNLIHDFEDKKCLKMLQNCMKHGHKQTKLVIIEDILTNELEPKEAIMHGLRLAVECRGGKQRTQEELKNLFLRMDYTPHQTIRLNSVHTMMVMTPCEG